ncbi:MAG: FAD-dependent thymidylate synthase [Candidatus Eiseniibacteriota bacterium]|nr:MAG: FAD-dependent thymidylate synthase [Candidatus Eisenbacteria bacterium]
MHVELISVTPDAERLIERAARTCYDTTDRMSSSDTSTFLEKLFNAGHLSVFEHASATFRIAGVSRACSHQLVRHRLASYSQRSQRYVAEKEASYVVPPRVEQGGKALSDTFRSAMEASWSAYAELIRLGIPREDARYVLPNACTTELVMSANFREWLHILKQRLARDAQWEIREMCGLIYEKLREIAPSVFGLIARESPKNH